MPVASASSVSVISCSGATRAAGARPPQSCRRGRPRPQFAGTAKKFATLGPAVAQCPQEVIVMDDYDVLVIGGGAAG
jgi:hypothetical protein